jgi:hypothetical protein
MERINLLNIIPKEGSAMTLRIVRDLQTALALTEAEYKEFIEKVPMQNGSAMEVVKADKMNTKKDVAIGEKAQDVIVEALKALSEKKQLHISCLGLYERFVEKKTTTETDTEETQKAQMQKANKDLAAPAE